MSLRRKKRILPYRRTKATAMAVAFVDIHVNYFTAPSTMPRTMYFCAKIHIVGHPNRIGL